MVAFLQQKMALAYAKNLVGIFPFLKMSCRVTRKGYWVSFAYTFSILLCQWALFLHQPGNGNNHSPTPRIFGPNFFFLVSLQRQSLSSKFGSQFLGQPSSCASLGPPPRPFDLAGLILSRSRHSFLC
jgi:hypothetical protein